MSVRRWNARRIFGGCCILQQFISIMPWDAEFMLTWLTYRCVEQPFVRIGHAVTRTRKPGGQVTLAAGASRAT